MLIPSKKTAEFVREITSQCFSSRKDRINRGNFFQGFYESGANDPTNPAFYNKIFALLDDEQSLLYSPVSLRFKITDPDLPGVLSRQKGRAASTRLRNDFRKVDLDTMVSGVVEMAQVKGKGFIRLMYAAEKFNPTLVAPESMGVLREDHPTLDRDMEAFSFKTTITMWQVRRLIRALGWSEEEQNRAIDKVKVYLKLEKSDEERRGSAMQVTVGGMYPFQPNSAGPSSARGMADWLTQPKPSLSPDVEQQLLELDETWIWDDEAEDWTTFQMVGEVLLLGRFQKINLLAYDTLTKQSSPYLKAEHPFREFCINPVNDPVYFWGRSSLTNLVMIQEAINSRIVGTNKMLRLQEQPSRKFTGTNGVNQQALSRYSKPNGYFVDSNPNAKAEIDRIEIPQDLWASLHEYERMMDDSVGVPPVARGKNEQGVRSRAHAETLVRQFSPRFKDKALLVERSVEGLGGLALDLKRAHDAKKIIAWAPLADAGVEAEEPNLLLPPPVKGLVSVSFTFADLPEDVSVTVDSHSSSPAFSEEAKQLTFDLFKIGAEDAGDVLEHVDAPDPDDLQMGVMRRQQAQAEAQKQQEAMKLLGKKH